MTPEQLSYAALALSAAPASDLAQLRHKAFWLLKLADELETQARPRAEEVRELSPSND